MAELNKFAAAGALLGAAAVVLGAFGTHSLNLTAQQEGTWRTASHYHLLHAAVMVFIGLVLRGRVARLACGMFAIGVFLFSGSLYTLVLTEAKWLGAIAPLGGLALVAGWITAAFAAFRGNLARE